MNLALFDFNGTITTSDDFTGFLHYALSRRRLAFGRPCWLLGRSMGFHRAIVVRAAYRRHAVAIPAAKTRTGRATAVATNPIVTARNRYRVDRGGLHHASQRPPPLCQIDTTSHAPATAAPRKPSRPKTGRPSSVGPPSTVSVIDEQMTSAASTTPTVRRLAEWSIRVLNCLRCSASMWWRKCPPRAVRRARQPAQIARQARQKTGGIGQFACAGPGQRLRPVACQRDLAQLRRGLAGHVQIRVEALAQAPQGH